MSKDRRHDIDAFLRNAGWSNATREFLAGDASHRRYERVYDEPTSQSAVLMDAPPDLGEDTSKFVRVALTLSRLKLGAPAIYHHDPKLGALLLEDFGDALFARVCADVPQREEELYAAAVDVLVELHRHKPPAFLPPYSPTELRREVDLLSEWYVPIATAAAPNAKICEAIGNSVVDACATIADDDPVLVQRDYHAENLLWLPDRKGPRRVGLLDFQDALAGHRAYDLVSLLEDARRDTGAELRETMIRRYLDGTGVADTPFRTAYAILGAQRNLKIIGIFSRLCLRDGKFTYVDLIPRVWDHLQNDLCHPSLAAVKAVIDKHIPAPDPETLHRVRDACA